jgi:lipopolysaccharide exporter
MRSDVDLDDVGPTVAFITGVSGVVLTAVTVLLAPLLTAAFATPEAVTDRVDGAVPYHRIARSGPNAVLGRDFRQDRIFPSRVVAFVPIECRADRPRGGRRDGLRLVARDRGRLPGSGREPVVLAVAGPEPAPRGPGLRPPARRSQPGQLHPPECGLRVRGHQLGPTPLGIYVLAFNLASWSMSMLAATINGVAMPAFSRVGQDQARLEAALHRSTRAGVPTRPAGSHADRPWPSR